MDIEQPTLTKTGTANNNGRVQFQVNVPAFLSPRQLWWQAVALSNDIQKTTPIEGPLLP